MSVLYIDVSEIADKVSPRKKGLFFLHHHKPERHNLTLMQGGLSQTEKQSKIETNQSTSTRLPAA